MTAPPGSTALVTGGSRGIGRAIALALAAGGHPVAVNYRAGHHEAKDTVASIEASGGEAVAIQADVSDPEDVARLFDGVEDQLGPVGVLVNNAGLRRDGLALRMSDDDWDEVIRTNLYGPFACCRRALRSMLAQRSGRIVNITSVAGLRASAGQANYSAAKAGLVGLTRSLAVEVAGKGITVNAVAPGLIETELTTSLGDERFAQVVQSIPQKRAGQPDDVAGLVAWVCSEEARFVTGAVLIVDGGMSA